MIWIHLLVCYTCANLSTCANSMHANFSQSANELYFSTHAQFRGKSNHHVHIYVAYVLGLLLGICVRFVPG